MRLQSSVCSFVCVCCFVLILVERLIVFVSLFCVIVFSEWVRYLMLEQREIVDRNDARYIKSGRVGTPGRSPLARRTGYIYYVCVCWISDFLRSERE